MSRTRIERIPYLKIKDVADDGFLHGAIGGNYNFIERAVELANLDDLDSSQVKIASVALYGERLLSPYFAELFYDYGEDEDPGDIFAERVGKLLATMLGPKWRKIESALQEEYDPIHNYLDEWEDTSAGTEESNGSDLRTDNLSHTRADNLTQGTQYSGSESGANNAYGFNSASAVGVDTSSGSNSGSNTVTNTGTQTDTNTGTTKTDRENHVADQRDRSGSHRGNIGNITSQKMINEEIELRKKILMDMVIKDCVNAVTIPVYF